LQQRAHSRKQLHITATDRLLPIQHGRDDRTRDGTQEGTPSFEKRVVSAHVGGQSHHDVCERSNEQRTERQPVRNLTAPEVGSGSDRRDDRCRNQKVDHTFVDTTTGTGEPNVFRRSISARTAAPRSYQRR